MTERIQDSTRSTNRRPGEHEHNRAAEHGRPLSRRGLLTAAAGVGASALTLGASGVVVGQTEVERRCTDGDTITVGNGDGLLIANQWSTQDVDQCVFRNDDGSYGWEWERGETDACPDHCPNYPEVVIGTKPWATSTQTPLFPVQLGDVDDLDVDLDIDNGASGEEWNLALEWWHTPVQPPQPEPDPQHEIMLLLEWNEGHDKGETIEDGAITDSYGNVIDHWEHVTDRTDWSFHIFRIAANEVPSTVDLASILEYLDGYDDDPVGFSADFWMTGIEIGNETWDHTEGLTTVHDFNVRLNGETATTGVTGEFTTEPVAPAAPSNLRSSAVTSSSVDLEWDAGSGTVDHYVVFVDGSSERQVSAGTTGTTVSGLAPNTTYEFAVTAVDDDGNESNRSESVTVTTDENQGDDEPPTIDGNQPADSTGDGLYNDITGSGSTTTTDVTVFFENVENPAVADYPDHYDFDGNGEVSISDVISLFDGL